MVNTAEASFQVDIWVPNMNIWKFMAIRSRPAESLFGRHGRPASTPLPVGRLVSDWTEARRLTGKWWNRSVVPTVHPTSHSPVWSETLESGTGVILATVAMTNRLSLSWCIAWVDLISLIEEKLVPDMKVIWRGLEASCSFFLSYIAHRHRGFNECYILWLCESCWGKTIPMCFILSRGWRPDTCSHRAGQQSSQNQSGSTSSHPPSHLRISFSVVHAVNRLGGRR